MGAHISFANELAARWACAEWSAVWQSSVLAALLLLISLFLKRAPAALRYWLWMLVPLRLLVMPILSISVPILPPPSSDVHVQTTPTASYAGIESESAPLLDSASESLAEAPAHPADKRPVSQTGIEKIPAGPFTWVMLAWGLGLCFQIARMLVGWRQVRRLVDEAETITQGPLVDTACKAVEIVGLRGLPRLAVTDADVSPFTYGTRKPVVVLPKTFLQHVNGASLLAVLTHEFAHLRRQDSAFGLILALCDVAYFFHPVVYWVKRRILFERERACDDLVLVTSKARPSAYANAICVAAGLVKDCQPLKAPPVMVAESFGELKGRLTALAAGGTPTARLSRRSLVVLLLLGAFCVPEIMLTASEPAARTGNAAAIDMQTGTAEASTHLAAAEPSEGPRAQEQGPTRIIHFPENGASAIVYVRREPTTRRYLLGPEYNAVEPWDALGVAQGNVVVPADEEVKLMISGDAVLCDLSWLRDLNPNDIHTIELYQEEPVRPVADQIMSNISGLRGLKVLNVMMFDLTDQGMRYLEGLTALEELHIRSEGVTDAGLKSLEGMHSLKALSLWATVTDEGLASIAQLPLLRELAVSVTHVSGPGLVHLAQLPRLEYLELMGKTVRDNALQYISRLSSLRCLDLRSPELAISDVGMKYIGALTELEDLSLLGLDGITEAGLVHLTSLQSLKRLCIGKQIATADRTVAILSQIESLEELELYNGPNSDLTDTGLSYLATLKRLRSLKLLGRSTAPSTDEGLKSLSTITSLRDLLFTAGSGTTDTGIGYLAALPRLERLCFLTDSRSISNKSLAYISRMNTLRSLDIHSSAETFTTSGVNELNVLTRLEHLRVACVKHDDAILDLSGLTRIQDLSFTIEPLMDDDLASIGTLTNLRWLQGLTDISDAGMAHLAGLTEMQRLNMGRAHLTDDGLQYLQGMRKLDLLGISGSFTGQGLETLGNLPSLTYLSVENAAPLSEQEVARLQAKREEHPILTVSNMNGPIAGFGGN